MKTTKQPDPLIVCAVYGSDDDALNMCKEWIKENNHTSDTHRLMRGEIMTWVEEKNGSKRN